MSWLGATKLVPLIFSQPECDPGGILLGGQGEASEVEWELRWNQSPIGWASSRTSLFVTGDREVNSVVRFDQLPIGQMAGELFGPLGRWLQPEQHVRAQVPMRVVTRMVFDPKAQLRRFDSTVDWGEVSDLLRLSGAVRDDKLEVVATVAAGWDGGPPAGSRHELYRGQLELAPGVLVADRLAPAGRLRSLRVGETWTFRAYRPVPIGRSLQTVRATVIGEEVMVWNGVPCEVLVVVFHDAGAIQPRAAREPMGRLWVRADGSVLKEQHRLAGVLLEFVRLPGPPKATLGPPT